jgi:hypothetical protein
MKHALIRLAVFVIATGAAVAQNSAVPATSCTVAGRVVKASSGEPLKAARVRLVDSEKRDEQHTYHAVTDAHGAFVMNSVLPGHYRFSAMRNGYVPQEFKGNSGGGEGAILTLESGQQLTDALFRLMRAAAVVGRITDEDGEPVAGVEVEALVKASPENVQEDGEMPIHQGALVPASIAVSNDLGEYRLYALSPRDYYLSAIDSGDSHLSDYNVREGGIFYSSGRAPKTNHPPMYYPGVFQRSQAQPLSVRAGDEIRVDFALRPVQNYNGFGTCGRARWKSGSRRKCNDHALAISIRYSHPCETPQMWMLRGSSEWKASPLAATS